MEILYFTQESVNGNSPKRKEKIYTYTYVYRKCVDFYVMQCSVRRSRARYVLRRGKNKESILSSLYKPFRDYSLIRGFFPDYFSPDEEVITKQAYRDESTLPFFFPYLNIYIYICVYICVCVYIYICIYT